MTVVNIPDYWPQPGIGHTTHVILSNGVQMVYSPFYPAGYRKDEYDGAGNWIDAWLYRIDPARGVLEFADEVPDPAAPLHRKVEKLVPGFEIWWGGSHRIGDDMGVNIEVLEPRMFGYQQIHIMDVLPSLTVAGSTFNDVLKLKFWQYWGIGPDPDASAIYYMAPGLGPIRIDYLYTNFAALPVDTIAYATTVPEPISKA